MPHLTKQDRTADTDSAHLPSLRRRKPFFEHFVPREKLFSYCPRNCRFTLPSMEGENVLFTRVMDGRAPAQRLLRRVMGCPLSACLRQPTAGLYVPQARKRHRAWGEPRRVWDRQEAVGWRHGGCPRRDAGLRAVPVGKSQKQGTCCPWFSSLLCTVRGKQGIIDDICPRDMFGS